MTTRTRLAAAFAFVAIAALSACSPRPPHGHHPAPTPTTPTTIEEPGGEEPGDEEPGDEEPAWQAPGCYRISYNGSVLTGDIWFNGIPNEPGNATRYPSDDGTCTGEPLTGQPEVVVLRDASLSDAFNRCVTLGGNGETSGRLLGDRSLPGSAGVRGGGRLHLCRRVLHRVVAGRTNEPPHRAFRQLSMSLRKHPVHP